MSRERVEPIGPLEPVHGPEAPRPVDAVARPQAPSPAASVVAPTSDAPAAHNVAPASQHNPIPDGQAPPGPIDAPAPPGPEQSVHGASLQHHDHVGSFNATINDTGSVPVPPAPTGAVWDDNAVEQPSGGRFVHEQTGVEAGPQPDVNAVPEHVRRARMAAQQTSFVTPAMTQPALNLRPVESEPSGAMSPIEKVSRPKNEESPHRVNRIRRRPPRKKK